MQPTYSSSRILLPVRPWFIFLSLIIALLLNFLPTSHWPGVPDWVALVLCFWSVREFRRVGMGWAFVLSLLMDVADGRPGVALQVFQYQRGQAVRLNALECGLWSAVIFPAGVILSGR